MHAAVDWRPPAAAGDALLAAREKPSVFVLIDGVFDAGCAIRHNELLRLLAAGVRVIGAASMGALRAAELHPFGMEGVGVVFNAYARGRLVGDDEVALLHGPAELDWAPISVPLVTIRATLIAARRCGVISRQAARALLLRAMAAPYDERTWDELLHPSGLEDAFRTFALTRTIDLKRADALAAVAAALVPGAMPLLPEPPRTRFSVALERMVLGQPLATAL